jgi:hypothetical protein
VTRELEHLLDRLDAVQTYLRRWRPFAEKYDNPAATSEVERFEKMEAEIVRRINEIEGCEHADVEDTGGPDGSQICLDCGRIR